MPKQIVKLPTPLPYQKDILDAIDDPNIKFINFLKSRQVGGSFLNKMLVIKWSLENNKAKLGYITPTLKLAKLFFKELVNSAKPFIVNENKTDLIIDFVTGSYVQFFSAESDNSIRGFQFTYVILDEVAFMKTETINMIIRPTWQIIGRKVMLTSTPNGNSGFFYDQCQLALNGEPNTYIKQINIYDNPFITPDEIEQLKKQLPQRVFDQEYMAVFLDGSGTVFRNILQCINKEPLKTGKYYAGIDWAKSNDYTVLTIINDLKEVVEIYRINSIDYTEQVKLIATKLKKYNPVKVFSEENNIGTVVNELLMKEYKNIQPQTLDNGKKKEIIENLVVGFEQGEINIPNNDILIRELQAFTCTYNTQTQMIKYNAPSGLHDDMVISLAYAYYAATHITKNTIVRFV